MFELDYQKKSQEIENWIAKTVHTAGFSDVVIAVSGGIDSAVSLHLAVRALGKDHVYALLLPHGELSKTSLVDGQLVAHSAGLAIDHIIVRDVEQGVNVLQSVIPGLIRNPEKKMRDSRLRRNDKSIRLGNMMARVRMIYLFDLAKEKNALVIGTENKTEHYLGYFTRFGDEASDIEPIRSLYKTQVWGMAKQLHVPSKIIEKAPSAGLWDSQTDEKEFGFSYLAADKVLCMHFEEGKTDDEIISAGFNKKLVEQVLSFAAKNDFKHHVPYIFE